MSVRSSNTIIECGDQNPHDPHTHRGFAADNTPPAFCPGRKLGQWEHLKFTASDGSQHWPSGDNWHADLLTEWDLVVLNAALRMARRRVRAELKRRDGAS